MVMKIFCTLPKLYDHLKKIDIDVKFIITIRNQADLLTSIFAYDYYRQKKNFKNFQNFIINFLDEEKEYKQIFRFDFFFTKK